MNRVCLKCGNMVPDTCSVCSRCGKKVNNQPIGVQQFYGNQQSYGNPQFYGNPQSYGNPQPYGTPQFVNAKNVLPVNVSEKFKNWKYKDKMKYIIPAVLILALLFIFFLRIPRGVIGTWKVKEEGHPEFTLIIKRNYMEVISRKRERYPIKIKKDRIIIDLGDEESNEVVWKYEIRGKSIIIDYDYGVITGTRLN